jgi:hypothetical protein
MTDYEILCTVIFTVPLLQHVQKFLAKVKATTCSTGKLLDSLPRNKAVVEMCSSKLNVAYCFDPEGKLPTPLPPPPNGSGRVTKNY